MGQLVNGEWQVADALISGKSGTFIRPDAQFRNWITKDGSCGISGMADFKAESGRYHLYVS